MIGLTAVFLRHSNMSFTWKNRLNSEGRVFGSILSTLSLSSEGVEASLLVL